MSAALLVLQELNMKHFILALSALGLVACGGHEGHGDAHIDATHDTMKKQDIEISAAYINPPFPGRTTAAGFFDIINHGTDDTLISASSPISENVEIHTHLKEDGVMKMRQIPGVDLPSGETVEFKSGSYHLMLFNASIPEGAEGVALTLTYENSDPVTLIVPIGEPEEDDHSSHNGH